METISVCTYIHYDIRSYHSARIIIIYVTGVGDGYSKK